MAEIFRPTYSTIDPATGVKRKRKSKTWHIRYYTRDGERRRVKGYRDRRATESLATELERRDIRLHAGIIDPTDEHAKRPLAEHLSEYVRYLTAKGNTSKHVALTRTRVQAVLDGSRFVRVSDVQPSAVLSFLSDLRTKETSIATANYYLTAVRGFTRWLWKDRRVTVDPLAGMSKLANGAADIRVVRRDLSPDEIAWLAHTTQSSKKLFRGLSGPDRRMLYLTADGTGFRVSELASMTPRGFDLKGNLPTATITAAYTKNCQTAVQPLPADLADELRRYLSDKVASEPVWPGSWRDRSATMLHRDMARAREQWLSDTKCDRQRAEREQSDFLMDRDGADRVADFHSLRHTYISRIVQSGASAKTAQTVARHSNVQLTLGRYAHASIMDLASAVAALPPIVPQVASQTLAATGTDVTTPKKLSPNLGPQKATSSEIVRQCETERTSVLGTANDAKTAEILRFSSDSLDAKETTAGQTVFKIPNDARRDYSIVRPAHAA